MSVNKDVWRIGRDVLVLIKDIQRLYGGAHHDMIMFVWRQLETQAVRPQYAVTIGQLEANAG